MLLQRCSTSKLSISNLSLQQFQHYIEEKSETKQPKDIAHTQMHKSQKTYRD
jgi:hypothetical protein